MAATVADIQIRSSLIDDYLQIAEAPVAPNLTGRFLVVQDTSGSSPSTQLVTIPPEGGIVHFAPDPTSHSGWSTTAVPVPLPNGATSTTIDRLAGFYAGGILNVLAYFPTDSGGGGGSSGSCAQNGESEGSVARWMRRAADGTWSKAALNNDAQNALGFTYQTDLYVDASGTGYLYGVTCGLGDPGAFFLVTYDEAESQWVLIWQQYLDGFSPALSTGAQFRMMPGTGDAQFTILWVDGSAIYSQGASIDGDGNFTWVGTAPVKYDPNVGPLSVNQIIALPGPLGASHILLRDGSGGLRLVANFAEPTSATMQPLTGGDGQPAAVTAATAGLTADGLLMTFVVDQGGQSLWILRQNGVDGSSQPSFDPWVQLGDTLGAIACPAQMLAGPEVFTADLQATVYHLAQAPSDLVWSTRKVAAPAPSGQDPQNISSYTMEVTALDAGGNPVGSTVLQVTADQPTTIVSGGLSYQIGPATPASLPTNPSGTLTLTVEAASLTASVVTVTATDGGGGSRWCQGDVVEVKTTDTNPVPPSQASVAWRLAGEDPNFPVTQAVLQSKGLISSDYSGSSDPVQAVKAAGQWMQANPQTSGLDIHVSRVAVPHWRIDFTAPGGPSFRVLSQEEAHDFLTQARSGPGASRLGGPESIGSIFGDAAHFFKHVWQELTSFTATIVGDSLYLLLNDLSFTINKIREAAAAVETIFTRIVQGLKAAYDAIKDVIAWLKQLFSWNDILVTHEVIKYCISSAFTEIPARAAAFQGFVDTKFAAAQQQVQAYFGNLEQYFEPGVSFNAYVNKLGSNPASGPLGGNSLAAAATTTAHAQNASTCNYVFSKAQAHYASPQGAVAMATLRTRLADTDLISDIITAVSQNWPQDTVTSKTAAVQSFVKSNLSDPRAFFDLVMVDFLNAAKDLVLFVLDTVQAIIDKILAVAAQAIDTLAGVLTANIDIPIVTWLYRQITKTSENPNGDQLTLLDLLSLLLAVPATILYKVMLGGGQAPPFQQSDLQTLQQGLPWPNVPSAVAGASVGDLPSALVTNMGVVASIAAFFGAFMNPAADALAFTPEPLPGFTQFLSWASVIQSSVSQVTGAPWSTFGKAADTWNQADGWTTALWGASWVPYAYETAFTVSTEKLARYSDLGPGLDTGAGWMMTALGAATMIAQTAQGSGYTGWDAANSLIPQPARGFKFLVFSKDDEEAAPFAMALLVAVDAVIGVGSLVTQIGATVEG
jgi:hypothetical protein